MTRRWRPLAATAISLAGFGLAAFLTWGHYFDQAAISRTCPGGSAHGFINCGAVTTSAESVIFGVPVALYGLLYFTVMVALNLPAAWRSPSRLLAWARVVLNVAGMGFVLYLVGVEFLELHYICLYCTFVHVLQFALFLVVVTGWYDTGYAERLYGDEDDDYRASRPSKLLGA
ncbi:MAG TPA: vitamin K epoxide reductase family protein [Acidimicrobiales bacterium]|nr:vitamin K epoxide reductase family protein [Acidimicrobiales bacterium]